MSVVKVSMNCRQFEKILADLDRPQALPAAMREAALAHAETCPECGLLLTESESLEMHLETMAAAATAQSLPERIEENLVREFRKYHSSERRGKLRWQVAAVGVAAAAALAVGLALGGHGLRWGSAADKQNTRSAENSAAPTLKLVPPEAPATVDASTDSQIEHQASAMKERVNHGTSRTKAPVASPAVEETAFVRLPYADSSGEIEGGEVVRVILSPAALESLGVQTGAFPPTDNVSADLLLNEDGTPEAIRLVAQADNSTISN
jgi:hypothetical protein